MIQTRQQVNENTIGCKIVTFATRDINVPPLTLNLAAKGQPEAYIVGTHCL
jgi:hypothetical protein